MSKFYDLVFAKLRTNYPCGAARAVTVSDDCTLIG